MTVADEKPAVQERPDPGTWADEFPWIFDNRYQLLCGVLVLLMLSYLVKHQWPGSVDVWEHAAAARELGARPLHPHHPLLPVDALHQFNSPYLWAVGVLSRLAHVSVVTGLMAAGVFNLVLFLVSLRLFVRRITTRPHVDFYALLFILVLWGPGAWFFSGFLHFDVIASVLTYPSTFAKGLVFLSLWAHVNYIERDDPKWLLPTLFIAAVVLLTHPVDAVFLGMGTLSLALTLPGTRERHAVLTVVTMAAAVLLALLWPVLPLFDLLFGADTAAYRRSIAAADHDMYVHVLPRLGLGLLTLPFAVRRLQSWRSEPLALMFFGALAGYGYGYATHNWSYGRLISSVQIVGAIILADDRAAASEAARALGKAGLPLLRWVQLTTLAIVLLGTYYVRNGFDVLPAAVTRHLRYDWVHSYVDKVNISDFDFIAENRHTYPVVISDLYTSLEIPTFGPKVVAFARTQAFVNTDERGADLGRFYDPTASNDTRRQIIEKYHASLLVVPVTDLTNDPKKYQPLLQLGREVSRNHRFVFVDLRGG